MARTHSGEAEIVGVAGRDGEDQMADFVERHDLGHVRHVADVDGQVWAAFGVVGQPTWVFVDGSTGESTVTFGALSPEQLAARLTELEAGASAPGGP